jgi:hypothetical protein
VTQRGTPTDLFSVVAALGAHLEVMQILLAVECDGSRLDFAILGSQATKNGNAEDRARTHFDIDLVAAQYDRNARAEVLHVTVPIGDGGVGTGGRHVERDDSTLAVVEKAVGKAAGGLLACGEGWRPWKVRRGED